MNRKSHYSQKNDVTIMTNSIPFSETSDMEQILEISFEEGYTLGLKSIKYIAKRKQF